jgi:hypothetical protein
MLAFEPIKECILAAKCLGLAAGKYRAAFKIAVCQPIETVLGAGPGAGTSPNVSERYLHGEQNNPQGGTGLADTVNFPKQKPLPKSWMFARCEA